MSMKSEQRLDTDLGTGQPDDPSEASSTSDTLLFELESRCAALRAELSELEARLRTLRIAADLCPRCGGAGKVNVRGGLYGEVHQRPCQCQVG